MSELHITKESAAQRQLDCAIRILFSGEDEFAVLTLAGAARGVLEDLYEKRFPGRLAKQAREGMESAVKSLIEGEPPSGWRLKDSIKSLRKWYKWRRNQPTNFLKHAEKRC